ncbi:MAG TPA: GNAT family N-acetyltransferase [Polyangiales bacterium]|nr:GNAT family N-acetyltransferase [Polyangiales bacterium]
MQPKPVFRRAREHDRALLLALCAAYREADHQPAAIDEVQAAVDAALAGDPLIHLYLIDVGERCAGYLAITIGYSIEVGGRDAFLDELYVEAWARSQGIGSLAIAFAEHACAPLQVRRLCMEVEHDNPRAKQLYERLGYAAHTRSTMSKRLQ